MRNESQSAQEQKSSKKMRIISFNEQFHGHE